MDPRFFGNPGGAGNANPLPTSITDEAIDSNADPYDFTEAASTSQFPTLDQSPDFKVYVLDVCMKEGVISRTVPIRIAKREVGKMYEKVSKMLLMEMGSFEIIYQVPRQSGKRQTQELQYHEDADILGESCELLFCQVKSDSHIKVQRVVRPKEVQKKPRKTKTREKLCTDFKTLLGTKNREAYRILAENPEVIEKFLAKLKYTRVLLNDEDSNNLLSPAHFYCPVGLCTSKEIKLHSFNATHNIQKHLINHDLNKNKMCSVLIDRMKFLDENSWFERNCDKGFDWMIENLELQPNLSLRTFDVVTVHFGNQFKGSSKCLDLLILDDFLSNNFESLKKIKDAVGVDSLLGQDGDDEIANENEKSDEEDEHDDGDEIPNINISQIKKQPPRHRISSSSENEDDEHET